MILQRFDANGTTVGGKLHIDKPGDQILRSIATLADGRVVVAYENETGDSTNVNSLNYRIVDPRETTINATNGNDNFVGREEASTINGFDGHDKLTGRAGNDILNGGAGSDTLIGSGGNDTLNGGANPIQFGGDTMVGGLGNDLYFVDSITDAVVEKAGEGTADRLLASVSYTLRATVQVEMLTTTNSAATTAINLTGNGFANTIFGNAGTNILNGGAGADTLRGLGGNDAYFVDNAVRRGHRSRGPGHRQCQYVGELCAGRGRVGRKRSHDQRQRHDSDQSERQRVHQHRHRQCRHQRALPALRQRHAERQRRRRFLPVRHRAECQPPISTPLPISTWRRTPSGWRTRFSPRWDSDGVLAAGKFFKGAAAHDADDRIIYNTHGSLLFDERQRGRRGRPFAKLATGLALTNVDFVVI